MSRSHVCARRALAALAVVAGAIAGEAAIEGAMERAEAVTINSYSFAQTGYVSSVFTDSTGAPATATLYGSFTGAIDPGSGYMELAGLTQFEAHLDTNIPDIIGGNVSLTATGAPFAFSFLPGTNPGSSLNFAVLAFINSVGTARAPLCVGLSVFTSCLAGSSVDGVALGSGFQTANIPSLTLLFSQVIAVDPDPPSVNPPTAPIPASLLMMATALAGLGGFTLRQRRGAEFGADAA